MQQRFAAAAISQQQADAQRRRRLFWLATVAGLLLAAAAELSARSSQAVTAPLDDPTIVAIFDAANTADIETGSLAAERGHSKEVRDFGAMLARDHRQVRQLGRDLAAKLGVTPTPPKDDAGATAHAQAMATLRAKSGPEFDRAFLQHEAAFHKSVIDAVQSTLLPAIENDELKALVVKVAPAFEAHMLAAQNLEKQLASK
jgi:putative membrane protein